jgi:hypothetical protein
MTPCVLLQSAAQGFRHLNSLLRENYSRPQNVAESIEIELHNIDHSID